MRSVGQRVLTIVLSLLVLAPAMAYGQAQTLTAHWDPNPPTDQVTAYEVCLGITSKTCGVALTQVPSSQTSFTFTPNPGVLYYFTVRAINAKGKSVSSTEVRASIPNFVQPGSQKSTINLPITPLNLNVIDPDGGPLQFSHAGLPFGLSLNPTTGQITGTPTATGTYNVTISVFDGLATVFRTFSWTIGDATAPIVKVTSHVSGQLVGSATVTLSGTATDYGAGGSGILNVKVNGQLAIGGAVTGNAIAYWSRNLTLLAGSNTITVEATDGAGNVGRLSIILNYGSSTTVPTIPPMTGASLAINKTSPQPTGTQVTFTASGSGGVAPYQYQWYVQLNGGSWQLMRSWSTLTTYTWTPTQGGTYIIALWARSAGATTNTWQAYAERTFVITSVATGVVARDTFTGTNGTLLTSHTPDLSPGSMWVQREGATAQLQSGSVASGGSIGYTIATLQSGVAAGSVGIDVVSAGSTPYAGVVFRVVDAKQMLLLRYAGNASIGLLGLFRRVNGSFLLVDQITIAPMAPNSRHRLEVRFKNDRVRALWDGYLMFERVVTDYQTATQHGILWHSDDPLARLDNFVVDANTSGF